MLVEEMTKVYRVQLLSYLNSMPARALNKSG